MNRKILILGLITLGLIAGLYLVTRVQNIRKGAAFTKNTLYFQPSESVSKKVGEEVSLGVFLAATNGRKVDFVETKVCYGSNLSLSDSDVIVLNPFTIEKKVISNSNNCLSLIVKVEKALDQLPSGEAIQIATLKFKAVTAGSNTISFSQSDSYASGPNADISQIKINIGEVRNVNYVVTAPSSSIILDKMDLGFVPNDVASGTQIAQTIGTEFGVDLMMNSGVRKVDITQIKFCYNDVLQVNLNNVTVGEKFTNVISIKDLGNNCVELVVKAEKPSSQLPSGSARVAIVYFKSLKVGSGSFVYDTTYSYASGPNTDVNMLKIEVGVAKTLSYTIAPAVSTSTCTESNWSSTLSPTTCPSNGQQTKVWTKIGTCTGGISHSNETVTCTYNAPVCTYVYSVWGACISSGVQTRTVVSSTPSGCQGTPVLSRSCTYVAPTSIPTSTPIPTAIPTVILVCTNGVKKCYNTVNYQTCVNGAWGSATACGTGQYCSNGQCLSNTTVNTPIVIKMAFAGVKKDNDQCAVNWPVLVNAKDVNGSDFLLWNSGYAKGAFMNVVPVKTNSVNSEGHIIYTISSNIDNVYAGNLSLFFVGPKHISIKYGKNNQISWYSTLAGNLKVTSGITNNYDFSEYPLLVGDVNDDGKINGQDFSLIKEKSQPITEGPQGADLYADLDGNCQVNSGDVRLIKESLIEINSQTY